LFFYFARAMEKDKRTIRKIIHIDMDAFYAAVEQRDNPVYRGKPIAVGGSPGGRGVVATASYEARKFGVRSAMSSHLALQRCPDLVFIRPRFGVYQETSQKIRSIFGRYTDLIEPLSLDEAYLDVTDDKLHIGSAIEIAQQIKQAIKDELQLTASAGVSVNKFIAKIASDLDKPDGLTFIGPSRVTGFMETLPVEKFFGVGKVTAAKMKKLGIHTGGDLKKLSMAMLKKHFGKPGKFYFQIVRGIDNREVQPHREVKSVSAEDTFPDDLTSRDQMSDALDQLSSIVHDRLRGRELSGKTVTLKVKYHDFKQITRSETFPVEVVRPEDIANVAKKLLDALDLESRKVRLLGIAISNFGLDSGSQHSDPTNQLSLGL
jgi:DNA polymerase-4